MYKGKASFGHILGTKMLCFKAFIKEKLSLAISGNEGFLTDILGTKMLCFKAFIKKKLSLAISDDEGF